MICKEDVVNWFRELKSYNRIDTMCVMLNMCLPFELRFLGTYLEDLGRRDAPELRGAELKVNNPQEFIADIASGEPTDHRSRRKMALFLALYRACNHTCATELFKTLEGWGGRPDLQRLFEEDVQHELLLVYTMATNHPGFSFEQRLHCGEIFSKLKSWEPKANPKQSDRDEMMVDHQQQQPQQQQQQHLHHQHHQHHHQQQPSQHQSMDSLHSNSPQQSPIQQQQQQQHHQPQHLQNSTPPPASQQLPTQVPPPAPLHTMTPNAAGIPIQLMPQGPSTMGQGTPTLIYAGQPITTTIGNDGTMPSYHLDPIQLPIHTDFTIPPPGPPTASVQSRWVQNVYQQLSYPPPSSSPHMSNPSSPIQSRTASPTRIHPNSVQHRISRNQQNDQQQQQQQQQQQNQSQMQNLKTVDEDQTMLMLSQMQLRNGIRQTHNTLPRSQSKQNYVNQLPPYHQQQHQQPQHHTHTRDTGGGSGSFHSLNYSMKGSGGVMMDLINHQPKSTGSDSGSSIGSTGDVSPPETPGVVSVSSSSSSGVPHMRSTRSNNVRNINGRLEKQLPSMSYSQLQQQHQQAVAQQQQQQQHQQQQQQQQQQFAGADLMVTSASQNFLTTGTTNGAAMSSNGNNGASGSGVVSGQLLISQAAAAAAVAAPVQPPFVYAGAPATAYQPVVATATGHMVTHRGGVSTATPLPHGTSFRTAPAYATTIQPQATADGVNYIYHPAAVVAAAAGAGTNVPSNSTISFLPAQPPPLPPSSTVASTQTASLPSVRSSPSPAAAATHVGLLQQSKVGVSAGMYGGGGSATLPYTSVAPSCYNCGSLKHTGLECPEASMEDMTRTTNFTLDYNTTSTVTPVTTPTTTSAPAIGGNNNTTTLDTNVHVGIGESHMSNSSSSNNSTSSSSSSATSGSGNGNKNANSSTSTSTSTGTGISGGLSNSNMISASTSSNNNNNNHHHHHHHHHHLHHHGSTNSSNSSSNSSSMDMPTTSPSSSMSNMLVQVQDAPVGASGAGVPSTAGSNTTNSTNNLVSASASAVAAASVAAATAAVYRSFFRSLFSLSSSTNHHQ